MRKLTLVLLLIAGIAYGQARSGLRKIIAGQAIAEEATPGGSGSLTLTLDSDLISLDQTGVIPIRVCLGTSVGISGTDVTVVFDDLGENSNKLSVTQDGTSLPIEMEYYNATEECAGMWVGVQSISNATDTVLSLSWNASGDDNSNLGGLHSDVATNVWTEWISVYHMGFNTVTQFDSTVNRQTCVGGSANVTLTNGIEGCENTASHFTDTESQYVSVADPAIHSGADGVLAIGCVYFDSDPNGSIRMIDKWEGSNDNSEWLLTQRDVSGTDRLRTAVLANANDYLVQDSDTVGNEVWLYGACSYRSNGTAYAAEVWLNGTSDDTNTDSQSMETNNLPVYIANNNGEATTPYSIDECWYTGNIYSNSFITMMDDNLRDTLITYTVD